MDLLALCNIENTIIASELSERLNPELSETKHFMHMQKLKTVLKF